MLSVINSSLQSYMKYSFFKKAYGNFINHFLKEVKKLNKNHFKDFDGTARKFVNKHWMKYFNKEKKKWEKAQAKKDARRRNLKNKKHRK